MIRVTLSPPLEIGATTVRVIGQLRIDLTGKEGGGLASKKPVAVLIHDAGRTRAFNLDGEEIPMRRLRLQYPHLAELDDA